MQRPASIARSLALDLERAPIPTPSQGPRNPFPSDYATLATIRETHSSSRRNVLVPELHAGNAPRCNDGLIQAPNVKVADQWDLGAAAWSQYEDKHADIAILPSQDLCV